VILDGERGERGELSDGLSVAYAIALSPFAARGETMEDLRERLYS
jgi:hypothetical protein